MQSTKKILWNHRSQIIVAQSQITKNTEHIKSYVYLTGSVVVAVTNPEARGRHPTRVRVSYTSITRRLGQSVVQATRSLHTHAISIRPTRTQRLTTAAQIMCIRTVEAIYCTVYDVNFYKTVAYPRGTYHCLCQLYNIQSVRSVWRTLLTLQLFTHSSIDHWNYFQTSKGHMTWII